MNKNKKKQIFCLNKLIINLKRFKIMSNQQESLMRKTKKELVDIIIELDNKEVQRQQEIKSLQKDKEDTYSIVNGLNKDLKESNDIVSKQQATIDSLEAANAELNDVIGSLKHSNDIQRKVNWCCITITIIVIALAIMF